MLAEFLLKERNHKNKIFGKHTIFILAVVFVLLLLGSGPVKATPSIVAWSSSGGNPTYKDNPQDLIYKVQPGDTITFTVTTNENCNFTWKVILGAKVLQTYEENNTKTSSFTWTVPNEISTWDIEVEASNYKPALGPYEQDHKIWTITTSQLVELSPGEDIQSAIDSLPEEGGVVELKEGTWHLNNSTTPILINRSGITLRGQGKNKTILSLTEHIYHSVIRVSEYTDDKAIQDWARGEAGWPWRSCRELEPQADELCNISNVVVEDIHLHGFDLKESGDFDNVAIEGLLFKNSKFSDIWIDTFGFGFKLWKSVNSTVQYSLIENIGNGLWDFGPFCGYLIKHNIWREGGGGIGIKFNGGCDHNIFTNNIIKNTKGHGLTIYGTSNENEITNNLICNLSWPDRDGIWVWGFRNIIKGNIIHHIPGGNTGGDGIAIASMWISSNASLNTNTIIGNLIYDVGRYGISLGRIQFPRQYTVNIIGNTIYKAGSDGIYSGDNGSNGGQNAEYYVINIKNNIISDCNGYGINLEKYKSYSISYNDLYNNTLGKYGSGISGENDISVNPLFANPENGDFHLKSEYGRWNPNQKQWVYDSVTSPCIDAGDPADDYSNEPDYPNGRINLGAYGNTREASLGGPLAVEKRIKATITLRNFGDEVVHGNFTAKIFYAEELSDSTDDPLSDFENWASEAEAEDAAIFGDTFLNPNETVTSSSDNAPISVWSDGGKIDAGVVVFVEINDEIYYVDSKKFTDAIEIIPPLTVEIYDANFAIVE